MVYEPETILYSLPAELTTEDAPILLHSANLIRDPGSGTVKIRLEIVNRSDRMIRDMKVQLSTADDLEFHAASIDSRYGSPIPEGASGTAVWEIPVKTHTVWFALVRIGILFADRTYWVGHGDQFHPVREMEAVPEETVIPETAAEETAPEIITEKELSEIPVEIPEEPAAEPEEEPDAIPEAGKEQITGGTAEESTDGEPEEPAEHISEGLETEISGDAEDNAEEEPEDSRVIPAEEKKEETVSETAEEIPEDRIQEPEGAVFTETVEADPEIPEETEVGISEEIIEETGEDREEEPERESEVSAEENGETIPEEPAQEIPEEEPEDDPVPAALEGTGEQTAPESVPEEPIDGSDDEVPVEEPEPWQCTCGNFNTGDVCTSCGLPREPVAETEEPEEDRVPCPKCSRPIPEGSKFCPYCGEEMLSWRFHLMEQDGEEEPGESSDPQNHLAETFAAAKRALTQEYRRPWWFWMVLVLALAIGIATIVSIQRSGSDEDSTDPSAIIQAAESRLEQLKTKAREQAEVEFGSGQYEIIADKDKKILYVNGWPEQAYKDLNDARMDDAEGLTQWRIWKETVTSNCETLRRIMNEKGYEDWGCSWSIRSNRNRDNVLLTIFDGQVLYDDLEH